MSQDTRDLRDRSAIRDVLVRYFHGADSADRDLVRSCFTPDAVARFEGRPQVRGLDALIAQMAVFGQLESGGWITSTHFLGSVHFRQVLGDAAETETYAFAFLVLPGSSAAEVQMRSLRYLDRWVRVDGGWKIAARRHTLDWSCRVPCDFARAFAQRETTPPTD